MATTGTSRTEPMRRRPLRAVRALAVLAVGLIPAGCGRDGGSAPPTTTSSSFAATATNPADALDATVAALPPAGHATITSPPEGATVRIPFVVAGSANVDAPALVAQALASEGARLCERSVPAPPGASLQGSWQVTLAFTAPADGAATLRVLTRDARGAETTLATRALRVDPAPPLVAVDTPACNARLAADASLVARGTAAGGVAVTVELGGPGGLVGRQQLPAGAAGPDGRAAWEATFDLSGVAPGSYELAAYTTGGPEAGPHDIFAVPVEVTP